MKGHSRFHTELWNQIETIRTFLHNLVHARMYFLIGSGMKWPVLLYLSTPIYNPNTTGEVFSHHMQPHSGASVTNTTMSLGHPLVASSIPVQTTRTHSSSYSPSILTIAGVSTYSFMAPHGAPSIWTFFKPLKMMETSI